MDIKHKPGPKPGGTLTEEHKRKIAATWAERNRLVELGRVALAKERIASLDEDERRALRTALGLPPDSKAGHA